MMKRDKVVVLAHGSRGGGSETFLRGLLPCLVKDNANTDYHVFVASSRRLFYKMPDNNLIIHEVPDRVIDNPLSRIFYENIVMVREINKIEPNICFCTSEIFSPIIKILKVPVVNVYHATLHFYMKPGNVESRLRLWYIRVMRGISIRMANRTVAVSHFERAEIGGRYPKRMMKKIAVIYHGVDHDNFCKPVTEEKRKTAPFSFPYILCVSDRHQHKCIDHMIKIFYIMREESDVRHHLVVVGRPKSKKVEKMLHGLVEVYCLKDYVHFVDYIDNSKIKKFYLNSSLYWTNSLCESFGLTPLEAMACGVPVLAAWRSALPEVFGDAALFYDPEFCSDTQIASKVIAILTDEVLRGEYIQRGLDHASKFSWDKTAKKYQQLLNKEMKRL